MRLEMENGISVNHMTKLKDRPTSQLLMMPIQTTVSTMLAQQTGIGKTLVKKEAKTLSKLETVLVDTPMALRL